ncbi:hypothetical protein GCM10011369_25250 [Neiella marina]|uniref:DUF2897 family protein n=1 Tax=Neiella marina TaxID=508461 RepID=A0A8J2U6E5_9GAMM|nr:DUF2897 family protein [Neiella marina]GGA82221.1 hypothetical protein GCM10011369_25250 [Neiella marina]
MGTELSGWSIAVIILLVLGVIVSNLMVLKYSAKMKWPKREDLVDPMARAKYNSEKDD